MHILLFYFLKIYFNTNLLTMLRYSDCSLPFRLSNQILYTFLLSSCVLHSCPSHPSWFGHSNNILVTHNKVAFLSRLHSHSQLLFLCNDVLICLSVCTVACNGISAGTVCCTYWLCTTKWTERVPCQQSEHFNGTVQHRFWSCQHYWLHAGEGML